MSQQKIIQTFVMHNKPTHILKELHIIEVILSYTKGRQKWQNKHIYKVNTKLHRTFAVCFSESHNVSFTHRYIVAKLQKVCLLAFDTVTLHSEEDEAQGCQEDRDRCCWSTIAVIIIAIVGGHFVDSYFCLINLCGHTASCHCVWK